MCVVCVCVCVYARARVHAVVVVVSFGNVKQCMGVRGALSLILKQPSGQRMLKIAWKLKINSKDSR